MNAAVRAIVRMGIYLGCKVYFIHEVRRLQSIEHNNVYTICLLGLSRFS